MPSQRRDYFMRRDEFVDALASAADAHGLILYAAGSDSLQPIASADVAGSDAERLIVASGELRDLDPTRHAFAVVDLPTEGGDALTMAFITTRAEGDAAKDTRALFRRLDKRLSESLESGVWGENVKSGGKDHYRGIRYSAAAKAWKDGGGRLKQANVANTEFSIDEPS